MWGVSDIGKGSETQMALPDLDQKISRRGLLGGAAKLGLGAAALSAFGSQAALARPTRPLSSVEIFGLRKLAGDYARTGAGVGIVALVGDDGVSRGYMPDAVGNALVGQFGSQGVPSQAYVGYIGDKPTSIIYLTKNNKYGPYTITPAVQNIGLAAEEYRGEKLAMNIAPR